MQAETKVENSCQDKKPGKAKHEKKKRVWEIDFLRGLSIFMMFLDHFLYDMRMIPYELSNFREVNNPFINWLSRFAAEFFAGPVRPPLHITFVAIFFLLSGISCSFSKNNFFHGLKILLASAIISGVTFAVYEISKSIGNEIDVRILFSVLLQLGLGVIFVALIKLIPIKWVRLLIYGVCGGALITFGFATGIYTFAKSEWLYSFPTWQDVPGLILGSKAWGSDYFSILWTGFTLVGAFIGEICYSKKESLLPALDGWWHKPISFLGRNTLWAYLLHQPIILGLIISLCLMLGYTL